MNNVLFESSDRSLNKFRNFDESTIRVAATLFDDLFIQALIDSGANGDSAITESLSTVYEDIHQPGTLIRIKVGLQAFFARRSIDPGIWTIFLIDENGDMYEPEKVVVGSVDESTVRPPLPSGYTATLPAYRTYFDIYFRKTTFYGQPLISNDRSYLKLVFSHNRTVVGGGGWCFDGE